MLDLTKLAAQMPGISEHLHQEATASRQRLKRADRLLQQARERQAQLVQAQQQWRERLAFAPAEPLEPLDARATVAAPPRCHTVLAADGSQISPSQHEVLYCYLINIGRVGLHYGQNCHPLLESLPKVYYKPEDLYVSRQWGIPPDEWMGYQRAVSEIEMLAEMAESAAKAIPRLALVDGPLVYWFLESLPQAARDHLLSPLLAAWRSLQAARVPLMGYVSASRNTEALNFLRLQACPYDAPDCASHCASGSKAAGQLADGRLPCQVAEPLRDATFWSHRLAPGERGPLWRSTARVLAFYDPSQWVYFCHLNVGTEIARVEMPQWVARDSDLLERALSLLLGQVQKGAGYPVSLAEAHNQAVVRSQDRAQFFALLEQQLIRAGLQNVGASYKEARKRGSVA